MNRDENWTSNRQSEEWQQLFKTRNGRFATTDWSMVRRARVCGEPLGSWIGLYWFPLYAWARQRGWSAEDAADQVQDFMEKVCSQGLLEKADPTRGKLRSLLLKSFSNQLASTVRSQQSAKRGGHSPHVSVDWASAENHYLEQHSHMLDPEKVYARAWAMSVIDEALEMLLDHYTRTARKPLFEALLPALEAPLTEEYFTECCQGLSMTYAALRQAAVRFRQRYRQNLLGIAAQRLGIHCEVRLHEELRNMLTV